MALKITGTVSQQNKQKIVDLAGFPVGRRFHWRWIANCKFVMFNMQPLTSTSNIHAHVIKIQIKNAILSNFVN